MTTTLRTFIIWNHRTCGRCGGTGSWCYMVGGANAKGTCYSCNGAGVLMSAVTKRHQMNFRQWQKANRPTDAQAVAEVQSGRYGKAFKLVQREV